MEFNFNSYDNSRQSISYCEVDKCKVVIKLKKCLQEIKEIILFNKKEFLDIFGREDNIRPDAMILGYPVITSDQYTHVGSLEKVSGAKEGSKEFAWFGLDKHVDTQTPPTFLVHTSEDEIVPVENSLKMACALSAVKIPFELHILPKGVHGMSVCNEEVGSLCEYNGRWVEWSIKWLHTVFHFEA